MEIQHRSKARGQDDDRAQTLGTTSRDDVDLMRLGKKPVLKRNFGFMPILGFSCTVLITWEGILIVSTQGLLNGGPAGVIWGFLIAWIGTLSTFTVIAELASMAPTAGGQYHWVAMLAPDSYRLFFSYITGWMTFAGWQAVTAGAAFLIGTLLQGVILLADTGYTPVPWQAMLFLWAILFIAVFINTIASKSLTIFEGLILVLHIFGFFAVLIPLVYLSASASPDFFTIFLNGGGWQTTGLSFMVGLPSSVFSLIGADSAVHMSEEIKQATTRVPRALILSIVINGVLGFAMLIGYLFSITDLDAALNAQSTLGYPFLEVFAAGTGSIVGACIMAMIIVILGLCSMVGALAASSRMLWSFSRDRGVPFWKFFIRLDPRTGMPLYAIGLTIIVSMLLSLIILGSSVAFNDIINLSVAGLYSSYLICCTLLLWRRCQPGVIKPYDEHVSKVGPGSLHWGPWRIAGALGIANNVFACLFLVLVWFWSFWPPDTPVVPSTMNYDVLIWGTVVLVAVIWYFVQGRKEYVGPRVEIQL